MQRIYKIRLFPYYRQVIFFVWGGVKLLCTNKAFKLVFLYRKSQWNYLYRILLRLYRTKLHCDISYKCKIGKGIILNHPYGIAINKDSILGDNVTLCKGVTIGCEARGPRKGCPVIGNNVWVGLNSTITGKITIGNNVIISPNVFVNEDIPSNSIVIGNRVKIISKPDATDGYIVNSNY